MASQDSTASLTYHPWQIDNKYYSASVQIGSTSSTSDLDQTLKNRVEASIMYFDSSKVLNIVTKNISRLFISFLCTRKMISAT